MLLALVDLVASKAVPWLAATDSVLLPALSFTASCLLAAACLLLSFLSACVGFANLMLTAVAAVWAQEHTMSTLRVSSDICM